MYTHTHSTYQLWLSMWLNIKMPMHTSICVVLSMVGCQFVGFSLLAPNAIAYPRTFVKQQTKLLQKDANDGKKSEDFQIKPKRKRAIELKKSIVWLQIMCWVKNKRRNPWFTKHPGCLFSHYVAIAFPFGRWCFLWISMNKSIIFTKELCGCYFYTIQCFRIGSHIGLRTNQTPSKWNPLLGSFLFVL